MQHHAIADKGYVGALPDNRRLANRYEAIFIGHLTFNQAIGPLVFKKENGVRIADGCKQETFCIGRSAGSQHFETWCMRINRLNALRVIGTTAETAAVRRTDAKGAGPTSAGPL